MTAHSEENKKVLQEKYIELQLLSMQIQQLEQQLETLDQRMQEFLNLRESLQKLSTLKANTKSLTPIGPGIFVDGTVDTTKGVLINVGAGVIVRKTIDAAQEIISKQLQKLEEITLELSDNLQRLSEQAHIVEMQIDKLT
ncbi:MAG: prefoldin subunit alpha [Candidatus Nanoarchaeia archaeon]